MLIRAGAAQQPGGTDSAWPYSRGPCISHGHPVQQRQQSVLTMCPAPRAPRARSLCSQPLLRAPAPSARAWLLPRWGRAVGELGLGRVGAVTPASRAGDSPIHPDSGCLLTGGRQWGTLPSPHPGHPHSYVYSLHGKVITGRYPSPRSCFKSNLSAGNKGKYRAQSCVRQAGSKCPTDPSWRRRRASGFPEVSPAMLVLLASIWIHS